MTHFIIKLSQTAAIIPFFTTSLSLGTIAVENTQKTHVSYDETTLVEEETFRNLVESYMDDRSLQKERARKIDHYFAQRSMPLEGYGLKMVLEAEKNGIDWRLIPAIAVRESSGGKHACGHNPFGWASCRITFSSLNQAIETIARNLGGNNPNTARYYSGDTLEKLYYYNGTVVPTYPQEVVDIMHRIESES